MTCIAALIHEGRVWMGGDGRSTIYRSGIVIASEPKVRKFGKLLVGRAGTGASERPLDDPAFWDALDPRDMTGSWYRLVPKVFEAMKERHALDSDGSPAVDALIGISGRLYLVDGGLAMWPLAEQYQALGSGRDLALGSLHTSRDWSFPGPEERLEAALAAAATHNSEVGEPFTIIHED